MAPELVATFVKHFPPRAHIGCSLRLDGGGICVLFGASGAGKTTILRCLAGLETPEEGEIRLSGTTWLDTRTGVCLPPQERGVGFLFQDYALFPHLSVESNVAYPLRSRPPSERKERARSLLARLGIESLAGTLPGELSGGEKQRVALARALAPEPKLLLLDEPLSALDTPTREELQRELRGLLRTLPSRVIVVTHDRVEALALGDQMAVLAEGRIRQVAAVEDVFSRPADLEVARVVGVETVVPARVAGREGEGLLAVEVGGVRLLAVDPGGATDHVFACIRAEEVILEKGSSALVSARNQLKGRVSSLVPEGALVRVTVECGFPLSALVTRRSQAELGLVPGAEVTAFVKSPSVHLIPRQSPPPTKER